MDYSLLKQHFETQKLNGVINKNSPMGDFVNRADNQLCKWADNKDPEHAVKLICEVSDWMTHNGYDLESVLKEVVNAETNKILDCNFNNPFIGTLPLPEKETKVLNKTYKRLLSDKPTKLNKNGK